MKFFNTLGETLVILVTLLAFYSTSEANVSILDNGDPGTSSSGTWKISGGANPYGSNSIYSPTGGATYRFSVNLPKPGEYKVFARWTEWGNRRTSVPYDIKHVGGTNTVTVNQREKGGQWNQLGSTWLFDTKAAITLRSLGDGTTSADAIKIVLVTESLETGDSSGTGPNPNEGSASTLDNGGPGTSSSGTWKISAGANPYGSNSIYSSTGGATYRFSVNLPKPGEYKVFARWTEWGNRRTSVPYDIKHAGGTNTVTVNQKEKGGQWNQLGSTWLFDTEATITLRSLGDGTTSADAIKLVPVERANTPPAISGVSPTQIVANNLYSFKPVAYDADGDPLTFSISNKPNWASFNTATGKLSGAPAASNQGFYGNIVISVSDGTDLVSLAAFSIRVDAAVSGSARVATDLVAYYPFTEGTGSLVADQSGNGTSMDLTITGSVNWLGGGSGVVMNGGRVGTSGAATKMIDALRVSNTSTFEVWVKPANLTQSGPTRMLSLASGTSQQNFMIGQDGGGVEARLMHEGKDVWGKPHLKTGNGVLGSSPIHLVHTYDGAVERLYVNGVQRNETVAIGGAYGNWDVSALFSVGNEASSDRPYAGVIYLAAVYDRALGAAEIQQNFSAGPGNTGNSGGSDPVVSTVPVISGSPAGSVLSGNSYSFQPNATDADGDSLSFSISNKPGWASFNVVTGRLSGTPSDADAGTYGNVLISVTDGVGVVSLPAFSIRVDVTQTQTGSFTLSWTAPVARSDGTSLSLSEISGYRVYYGVSPGSYSNSIDVANATQTKAVNNIPAGTYYVVITTRDTGGRESGYSQMITKVAQ